MINTSRLTEVDGLDAASRTRAYERGRAEALRLLDVFRRHFPGMARAQIKSIAPMLGVRESRRIVSVRTEQSSMSPRCPSSNPVRIRNPGFLL